MTVTRPWHILKGNLRCETAHNIIVFDTETRPEILGDGSERDHLWFGWMCILRRNGKGGWGPPQYIRFDSVRAFWRAVRRVAVPKRRWFLFCHNTSYDLPVVDIFGAGTRGGWKIETAVIEAPPTIITLKRNGAKLTFLDTLNWWRMPLAKIGERLGLEKLPMPARDASAEAWDTYCRRDVDVLRETVLRWLAFLQDHDLGGFASTLAGQAFRTYRHRFMPHEITIDGDERALAVSRAGYYGGRVDCFKLGLQKGPVYGYDINSMYPAVMRHGLYPCRLVRTFSSQPAERWDRLTTDYAVVARVRVRAELPCYPVRAKAGLSFPVGEFSTVLTTPELRLAIERGELLEMGECAIYKTAPLFTDYVEFMWEKRWECQAAGDDVGSWLFKHLGTNLYGKFGQTGQVYEAQRQIADKRCMKFTIIDAQTRKLFKCRQLGGLLQVMSSEGEARDSFPAIAAHVTAYGRVALWRLIQESGLRNMLYCDTDSLYVTGGGKRALDAHVDPATLGELKFLGKWPAMTLHGLKDYELGEAVVRKGVRKDAIQLGPNRFQQTQWSSLKGLVELGDVTAPRRKQVVKTLARVYKKKRTPD